MAMKSARAADLIPESWRRRRQGRAGATLAMALSILAALSVFIVREAVHSMVSEKETELSVFEERIPHAESEIVRWAAEIQDRDAVVHRLLDVTTFLDGAPRQADLSLALVRLLPPQAWIAGMSIDRVQADRPEEGGEEVSVAEERWLVHVRCQTHLRYFPAQSVIERFRLTLVAQPFVKPESAVVAVSEDSKPFREIGQNRREKTRGKPLQFEVRFEVSSR